MQLRAFNDVFVKLLLDLQAIGNRILALYPQMNAKTESQELKNVLELHLEEIRAELSRVERVLRKLNDNRQTSEDPTKSISTSAEKLLQENRPSPLLDAAMISIVQQVEYLEAATYSTLEAYADALDLNEMKAFFEDSIRKVYKVDQIVETLAKRRFFAPHL
jgi:ferritin-like metal-binding protein YciE